MEGAPAADGPRWPAPSSTSQDLSP